jgi:hypothetical protein
LRNHCTEMLPKDLPQPFIIQFRTIMLIKGHGPDDDKRRLFNFFLR